MEWVKRCPRLSARQRISSITVFLRPPLLLLPWKSIFNYEWRLICRYINFMIHQRTLGGGGGGGGGLRDQSI